MFSNILQWSLRALLALLIAINGAGCARTPIQHQIRSDTKPWTRLDFNNDPDHFRFVVVSGLPGRRAARRV
jgi:hypothetical protein